MSCGKEDHETQVSVRAQALFSGHRMVKREADLSNVLLFSWGLRGCTVCSTSLEMKGRSRQIRRNPHGHSRKKEAGNCRNEGRETELERTRINVIAYFLSYIVQCMYGL